MGGWELVMAGASFAIGAAQAVAQGISSAQQAQAQNQYIEAQSAEYARVAELNNKAAVREYTEQSAAERIGQMQEQQAAAEASQEVQKEALQKKGAMMASTNAAGGALNFMLMDFDRLEADRRDTIRQQYEMQSMQSDLNISAYKDRAQNRIDGQQSYIAPASFYSSGMNIFGTALGIGGAAFTGYDRYQKYSNKINGVKE